MTLANSINSGTIASQDANNVAITGGVWNTTGTIDAVTIGGTTSSAGTFSTLTSPSVLISGGFINGTTIGNITPAAANFTYMQTNILSIAFSGSSYSVDPVADQFATTYASYNSGGVGVTAGLPAWVSTSAGFTWTLVNMSNSTATILTTGSDTINGLSSVTLTQYQSLTVQRSTATNNYIIVAQSRIPASGSITASNINVTDDNLTNANMYPVWVSATGASESLKTSSTEITWNPSSATLTCANIGVSAINVPASSSGTLTIANSGSSTSGNAVQISSSNGGIALIAASGKPTSINSNAVFDSSGNLTLSGTSLTCIGFLGKTTVQTSGSTSTAVGNRYLANSSSQLTYTIPSTFAVGDIVAVYAMGSGGFSIAVNSGQNIRVGSALSTTTTGTVSTSQQGDSIVLVGSVANTTMIAVNYNTSSTFTVS